jgi:apolipoprotein N-acyltransferase
MSLKSSRMQFVVLMVAGWAQSVSLVWPFSFDIALLGIPRGQSLWWLQLLAMGVFARSLLGAGSLKQAAWRSWVFSTAWMCGSIWWLYISMHTYGGLPSWLAAFAVLLLSSCLALFYMLACMLFHRLLAEKHVKNDVKTDVAGVLYAYAAIIFAACWMLAELARGTWLTGFPWGAVGYSHVDGPLAGLASYIGVYGMCFVSAYMSMLLVQLVDKPTKALRVQAALLALSFIALLVVSSPNLDANKAATSQTSPSKTPPLQVTLLQGNIPQNEKFQAGTGMATALSWYAGELGKVKTGLVVTPETAIPLLPQNLSPDYWRNLQQPFKAVDGQKAALIGIPMGNRAAGFSNSVMGFKPTPLALTAPYQYDKHHLVPFGEFIPPFAQWFIDLMKMPLGAFNRGGLDQPPFYWQGERLGLNICYEDLFGEELAQRYANPALAPTILVNLTNIAWFGNTVAIDQHLNIARLRSMELAKPTIRATNTGATVIIDALGQVTQSLERHTRGVLVGQVQGNTEITPYAAWVSRFWLWPLWLIGLVCIFWHKCYNYMRPKDIK